MESHRKQTQSYEDKVVKFLDSSPNIKYVMFSKFEDDMIKKYYPEKGANPIALALKKDKRQIHRRATALGVKCNYSRIKARNENSISS